MATGWARSVAGLCAGLAGTLLIAATVHSSSGGGDQVIVKFTSHSEAEQALSRIDLAAIANPARDDRVLEVARDFGERIGIPLRLESLTSGRELLLAVDHQALGTALAERLRQRDGVTGVEVLQRAGYERAPRIEVEFDPDSAFAETIARGPQLALEALSGDGPARLGIEAEVQFHDRNHAVLALDPEALMTTLLARIEADPDVQYAQPNLRLSPYRGGPGAQG